MFSTLTRQFAILAILIVFPVILNSCKKEISSSVDKRKGGPVKAYAKLETINFNQFMEEIGSQSPAAFAELNKTKNIGGRMILSNPGQLPITLETSRISKIKNKDHTTYTIPVKLASRYSAVFQNMVVDIENNIATTFLLSYYPDKLYRKRVYQGDQPFFTGKITRRPMDIASTKSSTQTASVPSSVAGVVCTTTTYVSGVREVLCDGGANHYVGDPDSANCFADNPAHYELVYSTSLDCIYEGGGGSPGGGDGGGGSTYVPPTTDPNVSTDAGNVGIIYPTAPSDYQPCMDGPESDPNGSGGMGVPGANICDPQSPAPYSSLTQSLQYEIVLEDDQAQLLELNPVIAGKISNLLENNRLPNGTVSEELKLLIRANLASILDYSNASSNPGTNATTETNDETTVNYDNTFYPEYQDGTPWPTIKAVIPASKFVGFFTGANCFKLAKQQIAVKGYEISPYGASGQTFVTNPLGGVNISQSKLAVSYLKEKLAAGIPVIVGVDYMPGYPAGNPDHKTDHFITVLGTGKDPDGRIYFQFYDNATDNVWDGTSDSNKLYYDPATGVIKGTTQVPFSSLAVGVYRAPNKKVIFTVTQVRKSKSK